MTFDQTITFAIAMFVLAMSPGPGIAAAVSRTLGTGISAGFAVTTGLIVGDIALLGMALLGLAGIAKALGPAFETIKYAGAAYLAWLGWKAWTAPATPLDVTAIHTTTPWKEAALGTLVSFGNPKPIVFYGALLPTFLDITKVGLWDFFVLATIIALNTYIVLGGYIILAARARRLLASEQAVRRLNKATGGLLIGSAAVVATR
jgi:threonine/homoserine/homoserine lactone efflux protein